jgi:hypothetical protein
VRTFGEIVDSRLKESAIREVGADAIRLWRVEGRLPPGLACQLRLAYLECRDREASVRAGALDIARVIGMRVASEYAVPTCFTLREDSSIENAVGAEKLLDDLRRQ